MAKKVLFLPFCDVLGHAGRTLVIAQALRERFDGTIAVAGVGEYTALFTKAGFPFYEFGGSIRSLKRSEFVRLWQGGSTRESWGTLRENWGRLPKAIAQQLDLYRSVKPDLIVWDGRWTVPISAEIAGLPFVSIVGPYPLSREPRQKSWGSLTTFPLVAGHPWLIRFVPIVPKPIQAWLFERLQDVGGFFTFLLWNRLRASFGLKPLRGFAELLQSLRTVIMPIPTVLSPGIALPSNIHYVGPVVWQPAMELPEPVRALQDLIYITMGSTGNPHVFKPLIEACSAMRVGSVVVTVGGAIEGKALKLVPGQAQVYQFLPGVEVARRAKVVICHGAPATMAQALSQGVPVIAIPLTRHHDIWSARVEALGAGVKLYVYELTLEKCRQVVEQVLTNEAYRRAAQAVAPQFSLEAGPRRAAELILSELKKG